MLELCSITAQSEREHSFIIAGRAAWLEPLDGPESITCRGPARRPPHTTVATHATHAIHTTSISLTTAADADDGDDDGNDGGGGDDGGDDDDDADAAAAAAAEAAPAELPSYRGRTPPLASSSRFG